MKEAQEHARRARIWAERFVPESMGGGRIAAEHFSRYHWAAQAVSDRRVLDAGCGSGYGSKILLDAGAASVVGVDIDAETVAAATEQFGELANFGVGDLMALPFADDSFNAIVCFEAIEHVADAEVALDELRRVLSPDGLLLISSPNRENYVPGNPHHVHEFTPDELHGALARRFAVVVLRRQHSFLASLIADDDQFRTSDAADVIDVVGRKVVALEPGQETYTLAIAGSHALPTMSGQATLSDVSELAQLESVAQDISVTLASAREQIEEADQRYLNAHAEGERLRERVAALELQLAEAIAEAQALRAPSRAD